MPNAHSLRRTIAGLFALLMLSAVYTAAQAGPPHNVYVALTAKCRVANSFGGAGPLVAGVDRNINVTNAASYAAQGGTGSVGGGNSSLGCGIPDSVSALMISTSVIPRGTAGTLKVFMAGMTAADGNTVAFNSVDATTNDMVVPARSTDTTAEITINSSRATDYILDVVGYFIPERPAAVAGYSGGAGSFDISSAVAVRSVTLNVPGPGTLIANAETTVAWFTASAGNEVRCSLSQSNIIAEDFAQYARPEVTGVFVDNIGVTRHFSVTEAGNTTVFFVCARGVGTTSVIATRPQLSVLYVP